MKTKKICFNQVCAIGRNLYYTAANHILHNYKYTYVEDRYNSLIMQILDHHVPQDFIQTLYQNQSSRRLAIEQMKDQLCSIGHNARIEIKEQPVLEKMCFVTGSELRVLKELSSKLEKMGELFPNRETYWKEYLTANWKLQKIFKDGIYKTNLERYKEYRLSDEKIDFIVTTYFDLIRHGFTNE